MADLIERCPHCGASFRDSPIAEADRESCGGRQYFTRLIACIDRDLDCCTHFVCPDCKKQISIEAAYGEPEVEKTRRH